MESPGSAVKVGSVCFDLDCLFPFLIPDLPGADADRLAAPADGCGNSNCRGFVFLFGFASLASSTLEPLCCSILFFVRVEVARLEEGSEKKNFKCLDLANSRIVPKPRFSTSDKCSRLDTCEKVWIGTAYLRSEEEKATNSNTKQKSWRQSNTNDA